MNKLTPHDWAGKYKQDWREELQVGDRCLATIRHKTDGTLNIHNAMVIVAKNSLKLKQITGFYNETLYTIDYNELNPQK